MVISKAKSVEQYLSEMPEDRRLEVKKLRELVKKNIPKGYEEGMLWGMITYYIAPSKYINKNNKQPLGYISIASQKNYLSIYLIGTYGNEEEFKKEYAKTGKKLDMGKSCIRFQKTQDLAIDLIVKEIKRLKPDEFILKFEQAIKNAADNRKNLRKKS